MVRKTVSPIVRNDRDADAHRLLKGPRIDFCHGNYSSLALFNSKDNYGIDSPILSSKNLNSDKSDSSESSIAFAAIAFFLSRIRNVLMLP